VVAGTQVLIWHVLEPDRLTAAAVDGLDAATDADEKTTNRLTEDARMTVEPSLKSWPGATHPLRCCRSPLPSQAGLRASPGTTPPIQVTASSQPPRRSREHPS
jgi:hypothetical protein